jgi:hypothetical protein
MRRHHSGRLWMVTFHLRPLITCSLILLSVVLCAQVGSRIADTGEQAAPNTGQDCKTDSCSNSNQGCASCVYLALHLPPEAWVTKTHCYTNAQYPHDYQRHELHEVPCGEDISWSRFDTAIVSATPREVVVRTTYHNRSSDRTRDVKLTVDWHRATEHRPRKH